MTERVKKHPRDYLTWAGMFLHPEEDADVFATLPGWRQREILFTLKERKAGRRPTLDAITLAGHGPPPTPIEVQVSTTLNLRSLRRIAADPEPNPMLLAELRQKVTLGTALIACTFGGEGKVLDTAPPLQGVYAYIWALAQFRKRAVPALPLSFFLELEEGVAALTGQIINTRKPASQPVLAWLDKLTASLMAEIA